MKKAIAVLIALLLIPSTSFAMTAQEFVDAYNGIQAAKAPDAVLLDVWRDGSVWFVTAPYGDAYISLIMDMDSAETPQQCNITSVAVSQAVGGSAGQYLALCSWALATAYPDMDAAERDALITRAIGWSYTLFGDGAYYPVAYKQNTDIGDIVYQENRNGCTIMFPAPEVAP